MPKVSVIIPVYRAERYIERCARSLFEQTLDDIDYIFVDDCSPDNSISVLGAVLSEYPNRRPQVTIIHMENNSGQAAVRKLGVKNAIGDYIIHCDSDDWIDTNAYEEMYNHAVANDADVVACDICFTDCKSFNITMGCHSMDISHFFENILIQKEHVSLCNKLFKAECYNKIIWPKGNMGEDMLICMQLVYNAAKVAYLPQVCYYYYSNNMSISSNMSRDAIINRFNQSILNTNELFLFFKQNNLLEMYREEVDRMLFNKKNLLRPLIREKKYYKLWMSTFPELNYKILFNSQVSVGMKVKHILALMNLYHKTW